MSLKNELLGTLLGDSYISSNGRVTSFRCEHCPEQLDYLNHLAEILRNTYNRHVSVYFRAKRNIHALWFYDPVFKELREKYYPNGKKSLISILKDVTDPATAVAYWLMDDGCIHYSTSNKTYLSPRFLIATCSETEETHEWLIKWFKENFGLSPYVSIQRNHKRQKVWLLLKFTVGDSFLLWRKVRHIILPFPSMKHKFRVAESEFKQEFYRVKYLQESAPSHVEENVCRTNEK